MIDLILPNVGIHTEIPRTKKSTSPELLPNVPELLPRKSVDMFDTVMVMKNHTSQIMYTWGKW